VHNTTTTFTSSDDLSDEESETSSSGSGDEVFISDSDIFHVDSNEPFPSSSPLSSSLSSQPSSVVSTPHSEHLNSSFVSPPLHEISEVAFSENLSVTTTAHQSVSSQKLDVSAALLSTTEHVLSVHRCIRIHGLETVTGIFVMTTTHAHFLPTLSHTDVESCNRKSGSSVAHVLMDFGVMEDLHWPRHAIQAVHLRRYLFRPIALQIKYEQRSALFVFDTHSCEYIARQLRSTMTTQQERTRDWEEVPLKTMTRRWVRGRISNWHYLLYLNARAGRTVCDLSQYPIMPWTLRPVDSDSGRTPPQFEEHGTYRNLTLPMGAQTPSRARHYNETYSHLKELGEVPFHYGSCYTSPAITLHFLVRLEPYTSQFIALQGGHFDHPDRMFYSLAETWHAAAEENPMDVRELIPELYALPELFHNINRLPLGTRQDDNKASIDDVVLPNWALGSSQRFVRFHRMALESSVVSSQLHSWIDLVFGVKQRGKEALECQNVFHPLTYEGTLDITQIHDPVIKQAAITQMLNFGQIPPQLFKSSHPKRTTPTSSPPKHWYQFLLPTTHFVTTLVRTLSAPVDQIIINSSSPYQKKRLRLLSFPRRRVRGFFKLFDFC
jgi:hypothetical protein